MRASLVLRLWLSVALAVALGAALGCAKRRYSPGSPSSSAISALPALPEPPGVLGELSLAHPDAVYRTLRELGRPLSSLLPAGFPMAVATLANLPPISADSFDPDLPAVGLILQGEGGEPGWVLAAHVLSGPELLAKLTTGDRAPFRATRAPGSGVSSLEPSSVLGTAPSPRAFSLAVFDNYLLAGSSAELLSTAGPYTARMLPRRPPSAAPLALRSGQRALTGSVVPALRALWAGYRTRLTHSDQSDRSAHGGRAPDFADPAQVILGADAAVESLFSLLETASALELDLAPFPDRLDLTLVLEPEPGADGQQQLLAALAPGNARGLLSMPVETVVALGVSRSATDREAGAKVAGDYWARVLGPRLAEHDAQQLRSVISDWQLGRGSETRYGFLGGDEAGGFLVTQVADAARLERAGNGLFGLLALPGLRGPVVEFMGEPRVSEVAAPADALPHVTRKKLSFNASGTGKPALGPFSFAWLIDGQEGFAALSGNADHALKAVVQSARREKPTLAAQPGLADAVARAGEQVALFAYVDAHLFGSKSSEPAPFLLSIGKGSSSANLRLEISKPVIDLALSSATGQAP